jgi:hypothetical protein
LLTDKDDSRNQWGNQKQKIETVTQCNGNKKQFQKTNNGPQNTTRTTTNKKSG